MTKTHIEARLKTRKAARPRNYRPILTWQNAKTSKGESLGYYTGIAYLSPATESGVMNTCASASAECIAACLKSSGRLNMPRNTQARIEKTLLLFQARELFLDCLRWDIGRTIRRAAKLGFCAHCKDIQTRRKGRNSGKCRVCKGALEAVKPAVRLNGTSDLPWLAMTLSAEFPSVMFYDYTKHPRPYLRVRPNYSITFSYSGHNAADSLDALAHGVNVAAVFNVRKGQPLPDTWQGYPVIDGDLHDLRFLDARGVIVGLRPKGTRARKPSAFLIQPYDSCASACRELSGRVNPLVQIAPAA
jgi:hypothetical protein